MKNFSALLIISLILGACSPKFNERLLNLVTINTTNPITNNKLGAAISTYGLIDTALIAYRGLPRCTSINNFSLTNICYKRSLLLAGQDLDKKANIALNKAVDFQRDNPKLDASGYIDAAIEAVDVFKLFAKENNLPGIT